MNIENYKISFDLHRDKQVIFFEFPKNDQLKNELRAFIKVYYSATRKAWYSLDLPQYRTKLNLPQRRFGDSLLNKIHPINIPAYKNLQRELTIRGYSLNTQRAYLSEFAQFLFILKHRPADELSVDKLKAYIYYCIHKLKLKEMTIHSRLNSIKFYYNQILKLDSFKYDLPRPKKPSQLPKVISKMDIKKMFNLIENKKHKLALQLVYGMGLRVSEIVALKVSDIDTKRMMVHIQSAKGKKDRYVPLPNSILSDLKIYYREYMPTTYLFEGQTGGQYTIRSVQAVFKNAMKKANINKVVGIHGLRHSYATHLLEAGTDTLFIKELLGHANIKTTMIYTHVADRYVDKISSPLDSL